MRYSMLTVAFALACGFLGAQEGGGLQVIEPTPETPKAETAPAHGGASGPLVGSWQIEYKPGMPVLYNFGADGFLTIGLAFAPQDIPQERHAGLTETLAKGKVPYRSDSAKTPMEIDLLDPENPTEALQKGIFKVEGGKLVLAVSEKADGSRPTAFEGEGVYTRTFTAK